MPPDTLAITIPTATVRCRGSRNMATVRESTDGINVAPEIPSSARIAMSAPALGAYAASTDATPYAAAPISRRRRRPIRSPSVPMVISDPASRKA